jgi:hypothetical protein
MSHVNASHPPTVGTPANEDAIITAVEKEPCINSNYIALELQLSQPRVLEAVQDY